MVYLQETRVTVKEHFAMLAAVEEIAAEHGPALINRRTTDAGPTVQSPVNLGCLNSRVRHQGSQHHRRRHHRGEI